MTKEDALAFKQRWQFVNAFIADEIRTTSPEVRLQQLRTMIATALRLSPSSSTINATDEVRERWLRLKDQLHASS